LNAKEVREIAIDYEIAWQPMPGSNIGEGAILMLKERTGAEVQSLHWNQPSFSYNVPRSIVFIRKSSSGNILKTSFNNVPYLVVRNGFSQAGLDSLLKSGRNRWIIIVYNHLYENETEIPQQISKEKANKFFTLKSVFEKQVRLLRNSNYWISSESDIYKYKKEKSESSIQTERYKNMIFLKVSNRLDPDVFDQPLTLEYKSSARIIKLKGSETDGTFMNRNGSLLFNVLPNKEVIIEIIE